jgi:hypothetical protein
MSETSTLGMSEFYFIQRSLYFPSTRPNSSVSEGQRFVYNVNIVRQLCAEIARQKDSQRVQELLSLLHAIIREDQEEIGIRMAFLAKKYASVVAEFQAD